MSLVKLAYMYGGNYYFPDDWSFIKLAADNFFRDRATLMLHDGQGNVLVAKNKAGFNKSPFYFPGGGVYEKESVNNPIPDNNVVNRGLKLEAREEMGYKLNNIEDFGHQPHERVMPESWQNKSIKKRGFKMQGIRDHFRAAQIDAVNNNKYNVHGDSYYKLKPEFMSAKDVADQLRAHAATDVSEANKASMLAHADFLDSIHGKYGNGAGAPDKFTQLAHNAKSDASKFLDKKNYAPREQQVWSKILRKSKKRDISSVLGRVKGLARAI